MACVNEGSPTRFIHKWNVPCLPLTPIRRSSLHFGWHSFPVPQPGWLGELLRWFVRPKTVTHTSISRGGREPNSQPSSRESNAITTGPPSHRVSMARLRCLLHSSRNLRTERCRWRFRAGFTSRRIEVWSWNEFVCRTQVSTCATPRTRSRLSSLRLSWPFTVRLRPLFFV